jgi:hypothetical protein
MALREIAAGLVDRSILHAKEEEPEDDVALDINLGMGLGNLDNAF